MTGMSKRRARPATGTPAGRDEAREAQDGEDVEDVAADDVPDRDVALPAEGGEDRGRDLGERRPGGDDREADDELAHPEGLREGHGAVDEPARAEDEQAEPGRDERQVRGRRRCGFGPNSCPYSSRTAAVSFRLCRTWKTV